MTRPGTQVHVTLYVVNVSFKSIVGSTDEHEQEQRLRSTAPKAVGIVSP